MVKDGRVEQIQVFLCRKVILRIFYSTLQKVVYELFCLLSVFERGSICRCSVLLGLSEELDQFFDRKVYIWAEPFVFYELNNVGIPQVFMNISIDL